MNKQRYLLSIIFITLIVLIVVSYSATARDNATFIENLANSLIKPFQSVFYRTGLAIENLFVTFQTNSTLRERNQILEARVIEAEWENAILQEILQKYEEQLEFEDFNQEFNFEYVRGKVISRSSSNFFDRFMIDVGSNSGVTRNMAVVTGRGLVGLITEVGPDWSTVTSLLEPGFKVSFVARRSNDLGTLSLNQKSQMIGEVLYDANLLIGDRVVTSGLGSVFPKGLPIGDVMRIFDDNQRLTKEVLVEPYVDFRRLEYVYVVGKGLNV